MTQHIHILSEARCGSTYLFYTLREFINPYQPHKAQDRFTCYEPFSPRHIRFGNLTPNVKLDRVASYMTSPNPLVIMNHRWHLESFKKERPIAYEEFCNLDMHTILLLRRNLFDTALSLCIGQITHQHKHYDQDPDRIVIEKEAFERTIFNAAHSMDHCVTMGQAFESNETIFYEDLTYQPHVDYANRNLCNTHVTVLPEKKIDQYVERAPNKRRQVKNYKQLFVSACQILKSSNFQNLKVDEVEIVGFKE